MHEHHASQLHYDFRLELDGVLKSWAVPKGPSMNPHDHHLAVHVEDHPLEYRTFEGVIPEHNYGAGNVIIWDEGWYEPRTPAVGRVAQEKLLRAELKKGHLTFVLHGEKLRGEFALIKIASHADAKNDEKTWLLIKKNDKYASADDILKQDESVKSHRRVDDLGAHNKLPDLSKYPRKAEPWLVQPMLCTLIDEPFDKAGWLFEIKWDGYRAIGTKHGAHITLNSRNQNDFSEKFPPVLEAMRAFRHDVIVDGEIVAVDREGKAHFEWLQNWQRAPEEGTLQYYIFDILWCDGRDLRAMPLRERKVLLKSVLPEHPLLKFSDDIEIHGIKLFEEMRRRGMEGIVAKNALSPYRENIRGGDWLKAKTSLRQEVVIGGYTEPRASRTYLGSLVVGVYENGELVYTGHSGGGIPDEQRKSLLERLQKLERATSPFKNEPKSNAPVHWVRPALVCEMEFSEWTKEGSMRHPQFKGLRADKKPAAVHRELPKNQAPDGAPDVASSTSPGGSTLPFEPTHLDKIFFPRHKYTKGDMMHYYESAAEFILPYLKGRPCSLLRMPGGITGEAFFQKNNEHLPPWVPSTDIYSDSNKADLHWIVGDDLNTLLYMVQLGCVEINPWNSRVGQLDKPDWMVIDLDPEGVSFKKVVEVALIVKTVCDEWDIRAYPKTSGKTGIHIFIPLGAKYPYETARNLAHLLVIEVNKRLPKLTSIERNPAKRPHRIYLDWLQNREGQTLAAPYSLRPTPDASVSMPLHWDEVTPQLKPSDFTIENALKRLKRTGDIWKPVLDTPVDIAKVLARIEKSQKQ